MSIEDKNKEITNHGAPMFPKGGMSLGVYFEISSKKDLDIYLKFVAERCQGYFLSSVTKKHSSAYNIIRRDLNRDSIYFEEVFNHKTHGKVVRLTFHYYLTHKIDISNYTPVNNWRNILSNLVCSMFILNFFDQKPWTRLKAKQFELFGHKAYIDDFESKPPEGNEYGFIITIPQRAKSLGNAIRTKAYPTLALNKNVDNLLDILFEKYEAAGQLSEAKKPKDEPIAPLINKKIKPEEPKTKALVKVKISFNANNIPDNQIGPDMYWPKSRNEPGMHTDKRSYPGLKNNLYTGQLKYDLDITFLNMGEKPNSEYFFGVYKTKEKA